MYVQKNPKQPAASLHIVERKMLHGKDTLAHHHSTSVNRMKHPSCRHDVLRNSCTLKAPPKHRLIVPTEKACRQPRDLVVE